MGWASAGGIFDPIAQVLIDLNASVETKRDVLVKLIGVLRDGDWDTEGESLDQFSHDPVIVSAFYTALDGIELGDRETGRIGYDDENENWVVECRRCGILGSDDAQLHDVEWSVTVHNNLLKVWAEHDKVRHGGDGEVPEWVLIGGADDER
jgi:hypothetical protein